MSVTQGTRDGGQDCQGTELPSPTQIPRGCVWSLQGALSCPPAELRDMTQSALVCNMWMSPPGSAPGNLLAWPCTLPSPSASVRHHLEKRNQ